MPSSNQNLILQLNILIAAPKGPILPVTVGDISPNCYPHMRVTHWAHYAASTLNLPCERQQAVNPSNLNPELCQGQVSGSLDRFMKKDEKAGARDVTNVGWLSGGYMGNVGI